MTTTKNTLASLEIRQTPSQVQLLRHGQVVICLYHDRPDVTFSKEEALLFAYKTAAAHNMLEALEEILPLAHKERDRLTRKINDWSGDEDIQAAEACVKAAAAIAKAKGE